MRIRPARARLVALVVALSMIALACGGGSESAEPADTGNAEDVPGVIPTTPPLTPVDSADAAADDTASADPADDATEIADLAEDPYQVSVLHVNDDVQLVPAFDEPNGENITLYDINELDGGARVEYPLYADTVFGNKLALLVEQYDSSGAWAEVLIPVRPNGTTAWVQTAFFTEEKHSYNITIDISDNTVNVYDGDHLIVEQIAVTGRESRPTPVVRAYIDEMIRGETLSPSYGDWVLSIAAFSETLPAFGGGMPKLALHGTNQPELMGQYVSSGCIRVPNEIISLIADTVPVGTIVNIVA